MLAIIELGIFLMPVLFALYALIYGIKRKNIPLIVFPMLFFIILSIGIILMRIALEKM